MSQITTHVLDTALGKPAQGINITLSKHNSDGSWTKLASGVTNEDGRIADLLGKEETLKPGTYQMFFETGAYFKANNQQNFYPFVPVVFEIKDSSHYHVPLLLNPFGYSTYRGS